MIPSPGEVDALELSYFVPLIRACIAMLISVGILTRNGGEAFRTTVEALHSQECEVPVEIVILDSGSTDHTMAIARQYGVVVHQIPPESFSFGESRDTLFSVCRGDIVATISQDAVPIGTGWLDALTRPIREGRADVAQGYEQKRHAPFFWDRVGKFYFSSEWDPFFSRYGKPGLSTVNLATSKEAWQRTGFGPIPMCSDKLFQKRVAEAGLRVVMCGDALVEHGHAYTTRTLFKRCANEGMALQRLGVRVKSRQTVRDVFMRHMYVKLFKGIARGDVRSTAEVVYPILRPVAIWYGNRFLEGYWR